MTLRPNIVFMFEDNSTCGPVRDVLERRSVSNCFGRGSLGERTGSGKPKKGKAPGRGPFGGLCRVRGIGPRRPVQEQPGPFPGRSSDPSGDATLSHPWGRLCPSIKRT